MIEDVLPQNALNLIDKLAVHIDSFYLAGGTALALQLGHRVSENLDFFIDKSFDAEELKNRILHPTLLKNSEEWSWDSVRFFFETHLREFEIALTNGIEDG